MICWIFHFLVNIEFFAKIKLLWKIFYISDINSAKSNNETYIDRRKIMKKSKFIQTMSNSTFPKKFNKPEIIENFYDTFVDCKKDLKHQKMDQNCEEEFILIGWKNLRKLLVSKYQNDKCLLKPEKNVMNPLSSFSTNFLR